MKEDCELAVEVLHIVLDNIAYENKDENGKIISDYQIYPLENSHKQIMYHQVYKNHLFGLLFKLKLIKTRKGRGNDNVIVSVVNDAMKWNSHLKDSAPYEFSIKRLNSGGWHVFLSISDSTFDNRPKLEQTHLQFLQKCRKEFIAAIPVSVFGRYYWKPAFRWLRRKDETTRLEGFQSHEALIFIFLQYEKIGKLTNKKWIDHDEFEGVKTELDKIQDEETKDSVSRRFSDFLDQYHRAILTPTAWGHYISDNVLMAFGTANNKARQLVAQWVVSQVNNEPWQQVAEDEISQKNETHDTFSYLQFQKFLQNKCQLDTNHPFIVKHIDAIRYLADTGEDIYKESVSDELKDFKEEVEESILPARSHNQAVEQGVQLISHCLGNGRSEAVATAMFSIISNEHQKVTYRHNEALKTAEIRPNQHMSGGTNDSGNRVAKSEEAKRLEAERNELGQEYITKSQASKQKAKYFIELCHDESYENIPKEAMKKIDKRAREKKTNKELATKEIRIKQKIDELTASIERNEQLKVANRRAKPRRKEDIKPATIERPVNQTGLFKVTNFSRKAQMKYIVEEIICLCIENGSLVSDDEIKAEKERLKKIKKVRDLKVELRTALGYEDPEDGKDDKKTQFKVQSQLTTKSHTRVNFGRAHIGLSKVDKWRQVVHRPFRAKNMRGMGSVRTCTY